MDWILPDIPDVIKAPLKAMGVMDSGVYAPRLVVNPASDQLIKLVFLQLFILRSMIF